MKKYLIVLVSVLLLLPMTVFADVSYGEYSTNNHVMVGGYKEITVFAYQNNTSNDLKEITIDYDPNYYKITKDNITITDCAYKNINKNNVVITISNGKLSIKSTKDIGSVGCHARWNFKVQFDFLALKSGKTDMKLDGYYVYDTTISSTITEPNCPKTECPKCEEKECPKCEEKECPVVEEKECPACECQVCPKCEEKECPTVTEEKNFVKDNALLLMIACFLAGGILMTVISMILNSKKKQEM